MSVFNQLSNILRNELESKWNSFTDSTSLTKTVLNDVSFVESLQHAFLFSDFILKKCQMFPDLIQDLYQSGDLNKAYTPAEYPPRLKAALGDSPEISHLGRILRHFRNRETIRIAWRDILGLASLEETMLDISNLAKACVSEVFDVLNERQRLEMGTPINPDGTPMRVIVLGMGKLGADELNFSSDIDLIFAYPEVGNTINTDRPVTHENYFTALCQKFLKVFNEKGPEGFLYRVDMRLRPFGESGPLVMSFNALEEYYELQGREWERYAMIKANVIAGDKTQGAELLDRLRPFIFRRYLDYSAYDSLREMKRAISMEVSKKGYKDNIKLGAGGIREIEFFGQVFQLVRGGVEKHLQERSILKILRMLVEDNYIPEKTMTELVEAYHFLRLAENRLQEYGDQQTHALPRDEPRRSGLAASLGFEHWDAFFSRLKTHMNRVHFHFNELLVTEDECSETEELDIKLAATWQDLLDEGEVKTTLVSAGYKDPKATAAMLKQLRNESNTQRLSPKSRGWLDKLVPQILRKAGVSGQPELVTQRVFELINKVGQRAIYLSLLLENPDALSQLVKLSDESSWISSFLSKHPILLDELLDKRTLFEPPNKEEQEKTLFRKLSQIEEDDLEKQLEELIIFKNVNVLHVAAADISGGFQLMKVSDYLSDTAETVLNQVLGLSWSHLVKKYGQPNACILDKACDMGFAIIAYGKLGGFELSYGSDLDLVFVNAAVDGDTTGNEMRIDNAQFYARLGQRVVHLLTTLTRAGKLYEIDMRLRPNGNSGILVSRIDAFQDYQLNEAWTWEHQALLRARPICGDPALIDRFLEIKKEIITQPRDQEALKEDIQFMRNKMREEKEVKKPGQFDIKQGRGGLIDIEFLVQFLALSHAAQYPEFARWTDNVRLIGTANKTGILENETANDLRGAYLTYRSEVHRLNLQEQKAYVAEDLFGGIQTRIGEIWDSFLG